MNYNNNQNQQYGQAQGYSPQPPGNVQYGQQQQQYNSPQQQGKFFFNRGRAKTDRLNFFLLPVIIVNIYHF